MENVDSADAPADSLSTAGCRKLLGDDADGLSDRDVEAIRELADTMARVLVEIFVENSAKPH